MWGMTETRRIKYMTEPEARQLMDTYALPDDKRKLLWPLVGSLRPARSDAFDPTPPSPPVATYSEPQPGQVESAPPKRTWRPPDPDRPLWLASAWLCGASYTALALLHGVSEQAIQQSVKRLIPNLEERHHRLGYRLPTERVQALRIRYYDNVIMLRGMPPLECAKWLLLEDSE